MPSRRTAIGCALLLGLGVALARYEARSAAAAPMGSAAGTTTVASPIIFTIPFAEFDDVRRLDQRSEIAEVIRTALDFSDSPIFLAAYVTADDARCFRVGAENLSAADRLVIETGAYLAGRGIEAERISGIGMGIDSGIGRAVVISFGIAAPPSDLDPSAPQVARRGPSER